MAKGKSRPTAEVNSGSMADIAFLLLIFFLVTTTIANDKGILMLLPPKPDPNEPPPEVNKHDKNIFKIQANSSDRLLVEDEPLKDVTELRGMIKDFVLNFGSPSSEGTALYNSFPATLRSHVNSRGRRQDSSVEPKEAVVSFKADRGTSYELYAQILDEIHAAYNEIYGQRIGLTAEEFLQLDKKDPRYKEAREGIPKAVSIAEPNKIGG